MNTAFTVKQASKILNLSTNSVYKYLKTGHLKAIRTQPRGRFKITKKSLEEFLGQKLPSSSLITTSTPSTPQSLSSPSLTPSPSPISTNHQTSSSSNLPYPTTKSPKFVRLLLIISLLLIILDLFTTKDFSFSSQLIRIILAAIFIILAYQLNNFKKNK